MLVNQRSWKRFMMIYQLKMFVRFTPSIYQPPVGLDNYLCMTLSTNQKKICFLRYEMLSTGKLYKKVSLVVQINIQDCCLLWKGSFQERVGTMKIYIVFSLLLALTMANPLGKFLSFERFWTSCLWKSYLGKYVRSCKQNDLELIWGVLWWMRNSEIIWQKLCINA